MSDHASQHFAAVGELRVGMFIHLKGGWLAHPFPLSNFKISSPQQIATIRSLGLKTVRWSPEKSDLDTAPETSDFADRVPGKSADAAGAANEARRPAPDAGTPSPEADPAAAAAAASAAAAAARRPAAGAPESAATAHASRAAPPASAGAAGAESRRRAAVAAQRAALQHCQRQFAEANLAYRTMADLVTAKPRLAREQSEALSRALVDKMLGAGEICIRLLAETAGDKASAHAINVAVIALLLGKSFGLAESDMLDLGVGAMLHDIGKLDLPERLRHREDHFSPSEALYYQEHVAHGAAHARRMGLAEGALSVIEQHHEHADGSGFPLRLTSARTSIAARIVALVNRYDNLCNPHVPSRALTPHEALSLLFAQGKSKFDATILGAFVKMMGVYPPGSAVQLTDDRFALVVAVNSDRPLKPRVLVHEQGIAAADTLLLDLESEPGLGIRRSLKPLALPRDALEFLAPRPRVAYFFEPAHELEAEAIG
ncbi:MAG TPA: DUF3391 domain-containing protein [Burkholderiaceae bacterium]|nr:DUF3391 domain-containing protein [Burkholderiaceae bacterium]